METNHAHGQIKQRIDLLISDFNLTPSSFAKRCSIDPGNFSRKMKGAQNFTKYDVQKITTALNVNEEWLISGNGEKFDEDANSPVKNMSKKGAPFYDVDFKLGFDLMFNDQTVYPSYYIDFLPYNKCTCWCRATGDSMTPTISSGDMVALMKIDDPSFLVNGEIYAIATDNGMRTIKRIKEREDRIELIADNEEYGVQSIQKDRIVSIFAVRGVMKVF